MKSISLLLVTLLSLNGVASAAPPEPAETLPALINLAIANNPELKSSEARWHMYAGKARQAGALDDPVLAFRLQNLLVRNPFSFGGKDPQTAKVIGISQQLPFWGKRALREEAARYETEAFRWEVEERKLELRKMVSETWYRLYAVEQALEIVARNIRIISDLATVAESRYSVGKGTQNDIFRAGLEKSRMLDMQITLQQQRKSLAANLNYLLFRPADSVVGRIPDFDLPPLLPAPNRLKELAVEQRPKIRSLSMLAAKGEAAHRLAQRESFPDVNLSFEYMFREKVQSDMGKDPGYDMFTVGLTFNIPLQQERRSAMRAESASESRMAIAELDSLKNSIEYVINDTVSQMERRKNLVELYSTGIIRQAEQALESAIINYRVGKVDFLTLLESRVILFNYERELYESKAEYMMALARLEAAVGVTLASENQKK